MYEVLTTVNQLSMYCPAPMAFSSLAWCLMDEPSINGAIPCNPIRNQCLAVVDPSMAEAVHLWNPLE